MTASFFGLFDFPAFWMHLVGGIAGSVYMAIDQPIIHNRGAPLFISSCINLVLNTICGALAVSLLLSAIYV